MSGRGDSNPPTSSRGVTSISLDWITYTVPSLEHIQKLPNHDVFNRIDKACPPVPPYTHAYKAGPARVYWNPEKPEFKTMVRLEGSALQEMRDMGYSDERLIAWMYGAEASVTRIDVAIDRTNDDRADVLQVWQSHQDGILQTASKTVTHYLEESSNGKRFGCTVYVGSRKSDWMFRIYDKAAQLNLDMCWARIELEIKGRAAKAMLEKMANEGIDAARAEAEKRLDPGLDWYYDAVSGSDIEPLVIPKKQTDSEKWLIEVALAAVVRAIKKGDPYVTARIEAALWGDELTASGTGDKL